MISYIVEKINGDWYIWGGNPKVLRTAEAVAGPFAKRYLAMQAVVSLVASQELER